MDLGIKQKPLPPWRYIMRVGMNHETYTRLANQIRNVQVERMILELIRLRISWQPFILLSGSPDELRYEKPDFVLHALVGLNTPRSNRILLAKQIWVRPEKRTGQRLAHRIHHLQVNHRLGKTDALSLLEQALTCIPDPELLIWMQDMMVEPFAHSNGKAKMQKAS